LEFTYNNSKHSSTGLTPFFQNYGYNPNTPATLLLPSNTPAADDFVTRIQNLTKAAQDAISLAQAQQERYANQLRSDQTFALGDKVLLSAAHITLASQARQPTKKLQNKYLGPFLITKVISAVTYKLELLPTMKIHPVFHVSLLRKYIDPTLVPDRTLPDRPPPVTIDDTLEYEVEAILDK